MDSLRKRPPLSPPLPSHLLHTTASTSLHLFCSALVAWTSSTSSESDPALAVSPSPSSSSSPVEPEVTGQTSPPPPLSLPSQVPPQSVPPETRLKSPSAGSPSAMPRDPDALFSGGGIREC